MTAIPARQTATDGPIQDYIRALLRRSLEERTARHESIRKVEAAGHRVIDGGQIGENAWEITDWRTGELIEKGTGGYEAYDATCERLDPAGMWILIDNVGDEEDRPLVEHDGIPASLAEALQDWLGWAGTTDGDVARFVGWPVKKVGRHREST
ncbi:hypothetical protein [Streptomyces sp. NPDC000410]|uniref:hypothetical protein n=1 Tax=Streptomyces sp. NPDC000410 TaxID=3154254 RepID=UPI00331F4EDF